jgi:hypothetical protein
MVAQSELVYISDSAQYNLIEIVLGPVSDWGCRIPVKIQEQEEING